MHGVQPLDVRNVVTGYATRGVFRSLHEEDSATAVSFQFHWLWNAPFRLVVEKKTRALVWPRLLPQVERGGELEQGVKAFLNECRSAERVEHRRLDPSRIAASYSNQAKYGTLRFRIKRDADRGVRLAIQVVNELFVSYLSSHHPQYLVEHFRVAED